MDVNLLIAAIWSTHTNHQKADAWTKDKELVTCPISELGFLRISTHPRGLNCDMAGARALLEDFLSKLDQRLHDRTPWRTRPFQMSRVVLPLPWERAG